MRIRTGRMAPDARSAVSPADVESLRIRAGSPAPTDGPRVRMVKLAHPPLSPGQVGDTMMLFQDFLEHLDRLGLGESATHVSLGFERFRALYGPEPEE
jgi:hypothetical protein